MSGGLGERNTQGIEVERRGGVQAHHRVGSLKPLQDPTIDYQLSRPASALPLRSLTYLPPLVVVFRTPIPRGVDFMFSEITYELKEVLDRSVKVSCLWDL